MGNIFSMSCASLTLHKGIGAGANLAESAPCTVQYSTSATMAQFEPESDVPPSAA